MTRFILIRHGETDWDVEGRWQGQGDVPLNKRGREQALQITRALSGKDITIIYSSDLCRALDTAQLLASTLGLDVLVDPRLREIHQGEWQGLLISEIQARYTEEFQIRKENRLLAAPPGGETALQVMKRAVSAIREISQKYQKQTVAVVSHGIAIACILCYYQNSPIEQVWDLVPEKGSWQVVVFENSSIQPARHSERHSWP